MYVIEMEQQEKAVRDAMDSAKHYIAKAEETQIHRRSCEESLIQRYLLLTYSIDRLQGPSKSYDSMHRYGEEVLRRHA